MARHKAIDTSVLVGCICPSLIYMGPRTKPQDLQSFTRINTKLYKGGTKRNMEVPEWRAFLFCDQQALGEGPFLVNPLRAANEAGITCEPEGFVGRIFVAAFGPDGFAF